MRAYRGMDACGFLEMLIKNSAATKMPIRSLIALRFTPVPALPERLGGHPSQYRVNLKRVGDDRSFQVWVPRHEAAMIERFARRELTLRHLERATWHDESVTAVERIPLVAADVTAKKLRDLAEKHPTSALALSSRVIVGASNERHLTLVDFQCPPAPPALAAVVTALRAIGERSGVVVESGNSYHYYGGRVLTDSEWRKFLGRCLLLTPLTDTRYIGHRLIAGETSLRIAADRGRPQPNVVAVL